MKSPLSNIPGWSRAEQLAQSDDFEDQLRKAFELQPKYRSRTFDPHAEQLAADVVRGM